MRQLRLLSSAATDLSYAQAIQRAITPSVCSTFKAQGYAVVDGLFGGSLAGAYRSEVVKLYEDGLMHKNQTHLVQGSQVHQLEKSHNYEAELSVGLGAAETQQRVPLCASLGEDRSLSTMLSLFMPEVRLDSQAIKLQYNEGSGGSFPIHVDSDPSVDNRIMTAIFYLNPGWQQSQGGFLELYPWPRPRVSIEPLNDRLVIFPSQRMHHRVTPYASHDAPGQGAGRCCFTIWMSQSPRARRGKVPPPRPLSAMQPKSSPAEDPQAALSFLMTPQVRPHAAKLALADEWRASLQESHPPGPALDAVLSKHEVEVGVIRKALGRYESLIQRLSEDSHFAEEAAKRYLSWL